MEKKIILFGVLYLLVMDAYPIEKIVENNNRIFYTDYDEEVGTFAGLPIVSKWCIPGNISQYLINLESNEEIGSCCHSHDQCPDFIPSNQNKHGLENRMNYIASDCDCNKHFVNCLKAIGTRSALTALTVYVGQVDKCFKFERPITHCKKLDSLQRCTEYHFINGGVNRHQWFDHYLKFDEDFGVLGSSSSSERTAVNNDLRGVNQHKFSAFEPPLLQSHPFNLQQLDQPLIYQPLGRPNHQLLVQPAPQFEQQAFDQTFFEGSRNQATP